MFSLSFVTFLLYSYWLPQIVHSAYTGTKHSYSPLVLAGLSLVRLVIPLYFFACPDNFTRELVHYVNPPTDNFSSMSTAAALCAVVWTAVQVTVLCLQQRYGPRFFVPSRFLPVRYNYHRPVPDALLHQRRGDGYAPREAAVSGSEEHGRGGRGGEYDQDDERGLLLSPLRRSRVSSTERDLESGVRSTGGVDVEENQIECVICCSAVSTLLRDQGNHDTEYMVSSMHYYCYYLNDNVADLNYPATSSLPVTTCFTGGVCGSGRASSWSAPCAASPCPPSTKTDSQPQRETPRCDRAPLSAVGL